MIKIEIWLIGILIFLFTATGAFAASVNINPSDPDGTNGWYKKQPDITVDIGCTSGSSSYSNFTSPTGVHLLEIFVPTITANNGNQYPIGYRQIDGSSPSVVANCNYNIGTQSNATWVNALPNTTSPLNNPIYSNTFKVDAPFKLTFSQPTNNANLSSSPTNVTITSDSPSGLASVIINGVNASINSNGSATAPISLNRGLNTLAANATSIGGFTASVSITVMLLDQSQTSSSPNNTPAPSQVNAQSIPTPTSSPLLKANTKRASPKPSAIAKSVTNARALVLLPLLQHYQAD